MFKKAVGLLLAGMILSASVVPCMAAEELDVTGFTTDQWYNYETHMLKSVLYQNVTSFDITAIRDEINPYYGEVMKAKYDPEATEEDMQNALQAFHDQRITYQPDGDLEEKRIYLWEEDNMPTVTEYTDNSDFTYLDEPDFRPYLMEIPMEEGTEIKGTVILCSGGAFNNRCNQTEAGPAAEHLSALGYKCFILNYRVLPYTVGEGCLDLARAIRYVKANADTYGIDPEKIVVMGFSAGGFLCSGTLVNYDGNVNGTVLDENYVPDELDEISADVNGMVLVYSIVSATGELGQDTEDPQVFEKAELPSVFYIYGSADETVLPESVEANTEIMNQAGVETEVHVLEDLPHGFGVGVDTQSRTYEAAETWIEDYLDAWLQKTFA